MTKNDSATVGYVNAVVGQAVKKFREEKSAQPEKRLQFSQKVTLASAVFSMAFVVAINAANFILLWNGREPMAQETITATTTYGGITSTMTFGGYCTLSVIRDCSRNKHAKEIKEAEMADNSGQLAL